MKNTKFLVQAAIIGTIYIILTLSFAPISFGHNIFQFRVSEALTILPYFTPAAIPGLFVGCVIANMTGPFGILDIVFGSLATLLAAYTSYRIRHKRYLVPMPPVIFNALIVGTYLYYIFLNEADLSTSWLMVTGWVAIGQLGACYGLGYPLLLLLKRYDHIFHI